MTDVRIDAAADCAVSHEALQPRSVAESCVQRRSWPGVAALLVICVCGALGVGVSASDASSVRECGTTKVIDGHALRVQVLRGAVACRVARSVIRHHIVDRPTPGDLPAAPGAWSCRTSTSGIVTCTRGQRMVRGRPR